ncbi:MAG: tRNA dimethylallyltransferase [Thermoleophilaceae bacterium]|nr:tRNA dimethylallyltransferase [Thermoleophilaceae bacterium]
MLIALFGPTGVGKTAVAVALAEQIRALGSQTIAISADALQVYKGLEILTGVASPEQQEQLEHRLVSCVPLTETFSAGRFAELAHEEIDGALEAGKRPIVVGGTGLYLRAALAELDLRPPAPPELRARLEAEADKHGVPALHARLADYNKGEAAKIEPSDRSRVIRWLELTEMGVSPDPVKGKSQLWARQTRHPTLLAGLIMDREALYAAIDSRVDQMVAAGAAAEVEAAAAAGASETARKALGFEELLTGDMEGMKQRSRNYARRQLTWMRKLGGLKPIDVAGREPADVAAEIIDRTGWNGA